VTNVTDSQTFTAIDRHLIQMAMLMDQIQKGLRQSRIPLPPNIIEKINQLPQSITELRTYIDSMQEERNNLRGLASVSQLVNSSLELDEVLQIVMDMIIRLTSAERGFLMLYNETRELTIRVARNWEKESLDPSEYAVSKSVINKVINSGQPVFTTNAQEDPRFSKGDSIVALNLRSILCVPLINKDQLTGVIYADNRFHSSQFTQKVQDLLTAFANQAAVAIENARLFASVKQTLVEVTDLKNLMDNVFSSIASGVLTSDGKEMITLCNKAAETILGKSSSILVGSQLENSLPTLAPSLQPYIKKVRTDKQPVIGLEINPTIEPRGPVDLRFNLSPLKDIEHATQGVAIVVEDLTEKKKLEAQRRLFERMVSPAVIDQLDPNQLPLGGRRYEVSVLFADIRGFTSFSETLEPEGLVSILNLYLAAAADAVLQEEGTIDKFLGDAIMAWFNAPIPQPDHALRAVRTALAIRASVARLHKELPLESRLTFGVGIHLGDAVLGLIGTEKRLEYTAIGDSVNTAKRIQENSVAGQILVTQPLFRMVQDCVEARMVEPIMAKGKREPIIVYEVIGLR
jgi:adenylate cyclase